MSQSNKQRVPAVVLWSGGLYLILLVSTVTVWTIERHSTHAEGHHLYDPMVDGLKVGLGALIGVLSQWAHESFRTGRDEGEEDRSEARGAANPGARSP